jgi:hypothetical protein
VRQCVYPAKPNGSRCCDRWKASDCGITFPCSYACERYGTCQDGRCCREDDDCYASGPPPFRVPCNPDSQSARPCPMPELQDWLCCPGNEFCRPTC